MVSRRDRALLAAVVGTLLVLNPVWAFPHGGETRLTYEYRAHPVDDIAAAVVDHDEYAAERRSILTCRPGVVDNRLCAFERRVGPNGTLHIDAPSDVAVTDGQLNYPYEYVYFGGSAFYRPRANVSDGAVVLSFRRVTPETVAEEYAIPADSGVVPSAVRRAVDDGAANATLTVRRGTAHAERLTDRYEEFGTGLFRRGGNYYWVEYSGPNPRPVVPGWALTTFRALAVLCGGGLVFYAIQPPDAE